jgi:hypothetical protein
MCCAAGSSLHEQLTFAGAAEMDEFLDFVRAGTVFDEETDTLKSCFDSGTLLPPPQPTKIGIIVSKERARVQLSDWGRGGLETPLVRSVSGFM